MADSIHILQIVAPDYRVGLFAELKKRKLNPIVWCGQESFEASTKTSNLAAAYIYPVRNVYFWNRRLLWQTGISELALIQDPIVVNFNNRIISTTILLWLRSCLRLQTILWGHSSGQSRFSFIFRVPQLLLGDAFIAYTSTQQREISFTARQLGMWLPVYTANNACLAKSDCWSTKTNKLDSVLYVGRLIEGKKPLLLLEAYAIAKAQNRLPDHMKLVIVGDGPLRSDLDRRIQELNLAHAVELKGHVSCVDQLRTIYSRAICSVSPGYAGLSVTQSLAFGVPIAVADNEPHSPEIEACIEGFNSRYFKANDPTSLASTLAFFYVERKCWNSNRHALASWTADRYSFETMADAFARAFNALKPASTII